MTIPRRLLYDQIPTIPGADECHQLVDKVVDKHCEHAATSFSSPSRTQTFPFIDGSNLIENREDASDPVHRQSGGHPSCVTETSTHRGSSWTTVNWQTTRDQRSVTSMPKRGRHGERCKGVSGVTTTSVRAHGAPNKTARPFKGLNTNSPLHMNTLAGAPIETLDALGTAVQSKVLQQIQARSACITKAGTTT